MKNLAVNITQKINFIVNAINPKEHLAIDRCDRMQLKLGNGNYWNKSCGKGYRGMSDHTRPDEPVLMETFISDLGIGSSPNHTHHRNIRKGPSPGGNNMDAIISVWFSLIGHTSAAL